MNFVLHGYLARRDLGSSVAGVGAMLPDLWRMARRKRIPQAPGGSGGPPQAEALLAGVAHHVASDAWFHRSDALHAGEASLRGELRDFRAPKMGLLAHPLWEICLDGALLRRVSVGEIRALLAEGLDASLQARLWLGQGAPEGFEARMERLWSELRAGPWLDAYCHGEGIAWCLDAMRVRLGLPRLDPHERGRLGAILEARRPVAEEALAEVLEVRHTDGQA